MPSTSSSASRRSRCRDSRARSRAHANARSRATSRHRRRAARSSPSSRRRRSGSSGTSGAGSATAGRADVGTHSPRATAVTHAGSAPRPCPMLISASGGRSKISTKSWRVRMYGSVRCRTSAATMPIIAPSTVVAITTSARETPSAAGRETRRLDDVAGAGVDGIAPVDRSFCASTERGRIDTDLAGA